MLCYFVLHQKLNDISDKVGGLFGIDIFMSFHFWDYRGSSLFAGIPSC